MGAVAATPTTETAAETTTVPRKFLFLTDREKDALQDFDHLLQQGGFDYRTRVSRYRMGLEMIKKRKYIGKPEITFKHLLTLYPGVMLQEGAVPPEHPAPSPFPDPDLEEERVNFIKPL